MADPTDDQYDRADDDSDDILPAEMARLNLLSEACRTLKHPFDHEKAAAARQRLVDTGDDELVRAFDRSCEHLAIGGLGDKRPKAG